MESTTTLVVALTKNNYFNKDLYGALLVKDEEVMLEYKSIRDTVVFTNKRLIIIDIQGIIGKKKEFLSIPYSKITAFSSETAGVFDLDGEIKIWASGINGIQLQFCKGTNVVEPIQLISNMIL